MAAAQPQLYSHRSDLVGERNKLLGGGLRYSQRLQLMCNFAVNVVLPTIARAIGTFNVKKLVTTQ